MAKRPQAGQDFSMPARDIREFADAADAVKRVESKLANLAGTGASRNIVTVYNGSGSAQAQGAAMGITDIIINPGNDEDAFLESWGFEVDTPATGNQLVILAEPIEDGEYGAAYASGNCPAKVALNDAGHKFATLSDGNEYLESAASGPFRILWVETASAGEEWAVVLFDEGGGGQWIHFYIPLALSTDSNTHTLLFRFDDSSSLHVDDWITPGGKVTEIIAYCWNPSTRAVAALSAGTATFTVTGGASGTSPSAVLTNAIGKVRVAGGSRVFADLDGLGIQMVCAGCTTPNSPSYFVASAKLA